ncbi:hypothetical protein FXO38_33229 [Capsicum annuum]|uniref:Ubiquitin-like protease family profile domain-containing protein n=1 Tax=Capsicum annuum TaxID=4072 RepID=A0A2G2Y777_CAPAN|nr:hypothetical protein FXO38_33229 [Capsicum annuum]PHT65616.1 hypothetical protein T459_30041 [Capsicum annuum]
MDDAGVEKSPQRFSPDVVQSSDKKFDDDEMATPLISKKFEVKILVGKFENWVNEVVTSGGGVAVEIRGSTAFQSNQTKDASDLQILISDELFQSINLNYVHSEPVVQDDFRQIDIWFYYLRKKSKYEPHITYKYNKVGCNFMNIVRTVIEVYSLDDPTLNVGGHEYHLNEYINEFRMHATIPWHIVDNIFISINIKGKHYWVLVVLSFSERYIFIYDSYESSDHYVVLLAEIEKLAEIIPLCLKACNFHENKAIDLDNHPRYKDKDMLNLFDMLFIEDFPQQPSESL